MFWDLFIKNLISAPGFEVVEVDKGLFQGSKIRCPDDIEKIRDCGIDTVIDLEGGFDLAMDFLRSYLFWPIHDVPWLPDLTMLKSVASFGWNMRNIGGKVFVHCAQGFNRSGLVCGQIMVLDGMKGTSAVNQIQKYRPGSLWNPVFKAYLEGL